MRFGRETCGAACTYLRRGVAANSYIAERLTGRTVLTEHLYWQASNVVGPGWAIDFLELAACDWTAEEIDFVDPVFIPHRCLWSGPNGWRQTRD